MTRDLIIFLAGFSSSGLALGVLLAFMTGAKRATAGGHFGAPRYTTAPHLVRS